MKNTLNNHCLQGTTALYFCLSFLLLSSCISHDIGYNGYEKGKYRRVTYGNRKESVERKVFVKDLRYSSDVDLDTFEIFIEKGYQWGRNNGNDTRLVTKSKHPFQISFRYRVGTNYMVYYVVKNQKFDSITPLTVFLEEPYLKDTLLIGVEKYNVTWEFLGYIKVWDNDTNH
jgi:hypothetical protein